MFIYHVQLDNAASNESFLLFFNNVNATHGAAMVEGGGGRVCTYTTHLDIITAKLQFCYGMNDEQRDYVNIQAQA